MKNRIFIAVGIIGIFLLGCGSDDEELPIVEYSVKGTWELREVTMKGSGDANVAASPFPIPVTFNANGTDYDMQLVFEEDPQVVTALGSFNLDVKVSSLGFNLGERTLPIIGSEAFNGNWTQENRELIFTGNENAVQFEIKEINSTNLIFEGNPNLQDFEFEDGGIIINEASFRFVFDR